MAAALPVTKLMGLFVKTFAKPLSKGIKNNLGHYETSKSILCAIGQVNHKVTSYMTIWASGYRVRSIKPLEREKAMKLGAEFVGEGFVLGVSAGVVIFEYNRSSKNAVKKSDMKRERFKATQDKLQAKLNTLDIRIKAVEDLLKKQQQLEGNRSLLYCGTEKPKYIEPPKEQLVPIADNSDHDDSSTSAFVRLQDTNGSSMSSSNTPPQKQSSWWKFW